jgi:hypothetical protein
MNLLKKLVVAGTAVLMLICVGYAADSDSAGTVTVKLKPSGFASMQYGQDIRGGFNIRTRKNVDGMVMRNLKAGLSFNTALSDRNELDIGMEIQLFNDYPFDLQATTYDFRYQYFYSYLSKAVYTHVFGNINNPYLTVSAGYFPFKYNDDARNLGEYLFRTGTYPQYIINDFDFAMARLMGVYAKYTPLKNLTIDAILNSNLQWYAVNDWNLTGIASYKIANMIDIGIGASFTSIISADSASTTPHDVRTAYHITYNGSTGIADTSFYTFKGVKLMAKAAIDLKELIPCCKDKLGKNDLRIYSEAAILGVKDYPLNFNGGVRYDSILERIPVMIGINLPTYKMLDVLSFEIEWFGSRYPNDVGALLYSGLPYAGQINEDGKTDYRSMSIYKNDNWKWSCYATKTIDKYYSITAQIASDHSRPLAVNQENVDFEEFMHSTNQFYYMLKFTAGF